ncbi:MAG: hypothetical protein JSV03_00815 [Planctomycetota bacterium]|nr:MAG: hypothetical protein JSV03_00815 [Planctomycetota bacterium]
METGSKLINGCYLLGRVLVLSAVLTLGLSNPTAAVTTITDTFADDSSSLRDDGDTLQGVTTEVGGAIWDAEPDVIFVQPDGVVTNELELVDGAEGIGAHVPIDGSTFPAGTKYSVKVDARFQQAEGVDNPVNYIQMGFIAEDALWNSFNTPGSLHVVVYHDGKIDVNYEGNLLADESHPNFNAFTLDLDGFNTIELVYHENLCAVQVFVSGTNVFVPRLTPGQYVPTIGKAGFRCDTHLSTGPGNNVPAGTVEFDNFEVTADDSTAISVVDGPVVWGGHTYYLLSPSGWAAAQKKAQELGGNLITIETQVENDWLYSQWGNYDTSGLGIPPCGSAGENCLLCDVGTAGLMDAMMIGYHQSEPVDPGDEPARAWEWVGGSSAMYTNWHTGNPNNSNNCPTTGSEANIAVMPNAEFGTTGGPWFSWTSYATVALMGVVEVDGIIDNGFRADWIYTTGFINQPYPASEPQHPVPGIYAFDEYTGEHRLTVRNGEFDEVWDTLTFSGTGLDDARMFAAIAFDTDEPSDGLKDDVLIMELDPDGIEVNSAYLSVIINPISPQPVGTNVGVGNMRYDSGNDNLIISLTPDETTTSTAVAYQFDLGLSTLIATFTGPNIHGPNVVYNGYVINSYPHVAVNPKDNLLYMCGVNLGRTSNSHDGDLISFDISNPAAGYTVLIDGTTEGGNWDYPVCPIYRGPNNSDGRETLVITQMGSTPHNTRYKVLEYYIDTLTERKVAYDEEKFPWNGQLDEISATVMATKKWPQQSGYELDSGYNLYLLDDTFLDTLPTIGPNPPVPEKWRRYGMADIDSPGFVPISVTPISEQYITVFVGDPNPADIPYKVINKSYSNSVSYTAAEDVDVVWLDLDKTFGTIASGNADTVNAQFVDVPSLLPGIYTANLVFSDDSATSTVLFRTIILEVKECDWTVTPKSTQSPKVTGDMTVWGNCATPTTYNFKVTSLGGLPVSYTVQEWDPAGGTSTDYTWLELGKTSGGPVASGDSDTVPVTITSDNTAKEAYLRFVPNCGTGTIGADEQIRKIEVTTLLTADTPPNDKSFKFGYYGDKPPLDADSCGFIPPDTISVAGGCKFEIHTAINSVPVAIGTVVDDPDAQNGKAFLIAQNSGIDGTGRHGYRTQIEDSLGDVDNFLQSKLGFTMVARLKVQYNLNAGGMIWTWSKSRSSGTDPVKNTDKAGFNIGWGGPGSHAGRIREFQLMDPPFDDINDRTSELLATTPEDQNAYHIIRVVNGFGVYGNRTLAVYYDEQPDPVLFLDEGVLGATKNGDTTDQFCFGTFGASAKSDVWFDWITLTNRGMYAPGEEDDCIGTLIPEFLPPCNDPFADVDGPDINGDGKPDGDGDVDQDDFAEFQRCYTGSGDPGGVYSEENCGCFDQEPAGGDGDVDELDYNKFKNCASGPEVPVDETCDDLL